MAAGTAQAARATSRGLGAIGRMEENMKQAKLGLRGINLSLAQVSRRDLEAIFDARKRAAARRRGKRS